MNQLNLFCTARPDPSSAMGHEALDPPSPSPSSASSGGRRTSASASRSRGSRRSCSGRCASSAPGPRSTRTRAGRGKPPPQRGRVGLGHASPGRCSSSSATVWSTWPSSRCRRGSRPCSSRRCRSGSRSSHAFSADAPTSRELGGVVLGLVGVVVLNLGGELRASPGRRGVRAAGADGLGARLGGEPAHAAAPGDDAHRGADARRRRGDGLRQRRARRAHGRACRPLRASAALAYLCVFGSLVGFSAYSYLLANTRPAVATSYAYVNPVIAVVLGVVLAGEHFGATSVVGAAIVLAAVVLVLAARASRQPGSEPREREPVAVDRGGRFLLGLEAEHDARFADDDVSRVDAAVHRARPVQRRERRREPGALRRRERRDRAAVPATRRARSSPGLGRRAGPPGAPRGRRGRRPVRADERRVGRRDTLDRAPRPGIERRPVCSDLEPSRLRSRARSPIGARTRRDRIDRRRPRKARQRRARLEGVGRAQRRDRWRSGGRRARRDPRRAPGAHRSAAGEAASPGKGRSPVSISRSNVPTAKTSLRARGRSSFALLGAHVRERPEDARGRGRRHVAQVRDAEVAQARAARLVEEDVRGLDVAVQDPRRWASPSAASTPVGDLHGARRARARPWSRACARGFRRPSTRAQSRAPRPRSRDSGTMLGWSSARIVRTSRSKRDERVAPRPVRVPRGEHLHRDPLAADDVDALEHPRARRRGHLAHDVVAAEEARMELGRGRRRPPRRRAPPRVAELARRVGGSPSQAELLERGHEVHERFAPLRAPPRARAGATRTAAACLPKRARSAPSAVATLHAPGSRRRAASSTRAAPAGSPARSRSTAARVAWPARSQSRAAATVCPPASSRRAAQPLVARGGRASRQSPRTHRVERARAPGPRSAVVARLRGHLERARPSPGAYRLGAALRPVARALVELAGEMSVSACARHRCGFEQPLLADELGDVGIHRGKCSCPIPPEGQEPSLAGPSDGTGQKRATTYFTRGRKARVGA